MTQKQLLESVLSELVHIKKHMPNGELQAMVEDVKDLKQDISDLKYTLLNPEDGVIVKTNQNTTFRRKMEQGDKEFAKKWLKSKIYQDGEMESIKHSGLYLQCLPVL